MDIDALTDDDRKELAKDLAAELDTGLYGDRAVLSRRQLLSLAGGSAGVAGLVALGVDPATAQSAAGQVGTASSPEDIYAYDLDVQNGAEFNGSDVTGVGSLSTAIVNNNSGIGGVVIESYELFPNSTTVLLPDYPNPTGIVTISETTTVTAASFAIAADDITIIADEPGRFGISSGTESFNVFDDGSEFVIENSTGSTRQFCVIALITAE